VEVPGRDRVGALRFLGSFPRVQKPFGDRLVVAFDLAVVLERVRSDSLVTGRGPEIGFTLLL
jgi:hypothetical protein